MKGSEAKMIEYMEGAGKRYVIPVYNDFFALLTDLYDLLGIIPPLP